MQALQKPKKLTRVVSFFTTLVSFLPISSLKLHFRTKIKDMAKLNLQQKREWALLLYTKENYEQKEIASKVGVSEVTISKWKKKYHWEELKVSITITKEEQLKNLYRQIAELNKAIASREEGKRFATSSEADSISKLANAIDKMETDVGLSDIISTFKSFLSWLKQFDLEKAQELVTLFDAFIKTKINK